MLTASAHLITAVLGSGVLSLAWCMAQLGWIGGLAVIFTFAAINYYSSVMLSDCYRSPDPVTGTRNYTYRGAVKNILGKPTVVQKATTEECRFSKFISIW